MRKEEHYDLASLLDVYYDKEHDGSIEIAREDFDNHTETGTGKNLLAVYDVNLDGQTFSTLDQNKKWISYSVKDITLAAYHASKKQYRPLKERNRI